MESLVQRAGRMGRGTSSPACFVILLPRKRRKEQIIATGTETDPILVKEENLLEDIAALTFTESLPTPSSIPLPGSQVTGEPSAGPASKRRRVVVKKGKGMTSKNSTSPSTLPAIVEKKEDEDVIDLFNSKTCLRRALDGYFGNSEADSFNCSCARCILPAVDPENPALCCSICNPELLHMFRNLIKIEYPVRRNKTSLKEKKPNAEEEKAADKLMEWAESKSKDLYGWCYDGPSLVVSRKVALNMAMLSRMRKLNSPDDILVETEWIWAFKHGDEVLRILNDHSGPENAALSTAPGKPPKPRQPKALTEQPQASGSAPRRKYACSNCGVLGHNSESVWVVIYGLPELVTGRACPSPIKKPGAAAGASEHVETNQEKDAEMTSDGRITAAKENTPGL
jgi:hypothetical protein